MRAEQLPYLMAFASMNRLRTADALAILARFGGDAISAWQAVQEWPHIVKLSRQAEEDLLAAWHQIVPEKLYTRFLAAGCGAVCLDDADYPPRLRQIYDPPLLLFYRGKLPDARKIGLAMVGSRRASHYGMQVAELLARDLAAQGAVIISGMARGIDSVCHRSALAVGGETVAVLGSGLDIIYPPENAKLYGEICEHGAVISEFPLDMPAMSLNFPRRNRLISGLSHGVIVVEAGEQSGTLHTVGFALEQGRDVFAVPGPLTSSTSRGANRLLAEGAKIVLSAESVWREYSDAPLRKPRQRQKGTVSGSFSVEERKLLAQLREPRQFEELAAMPDLGMDAAALNARLTMLELRGAIRQLPGKYFQAVAKHL